MCLMLCVSPNSNVYKKSYKFIHQSQINQFLNSHPLTTGDILNQSSLGLIIYILKLFLLFHDYKHCCNKLSCSPLYTSSIICLVCDGCSSFKFMLPDCPEKSWIYLHLPSAWRLPVCWPTLNSGSWLQYTISYFSEIFGCFDIKQQAQIWP